MPLMPEARIAVTSSSSLTVPRWYGSTSLICEPMCIARPCSRSNGCSLMRRATATTSSNGTPNPQHADVAVRLDRIADAVRDVLQDVVQGVVLRADQIGAVHVGGRPYTIGDGLQQLRIKP